MFTNYNEPQNFSKPFFNPDIIIFKARIFINDEPNDYFVITLHIGGLHSLGVSTVIYHCELLRDMLGSVGDHDQGFNIFHKVRNNFKFSRLSRLCVGFL